MFKPFLLNHSGWIDAYRGQTSPLEWLLLLPEMDQAYSSKRLTMATGQRTQRIGRKNDLPAVTNPTGFPNSGKGSTRKRDCANRPEEWSSQSCLRKSTAAADSFLARQQ